MRHAISAVAGLLLMVGSAAAQSGTQPDSAKPSINTPPSMPQNYRSRTAAMMAKEYIREGKGRPEISEVVSNTGLLGGSTRFCVRYPADVQATAAERRRNLFLPSEVKTRFVLINAHRSITTGGESRYTARFGVSVTCDEFKTWAPFPELVQAAAARKARDAAKATKAN
jgi:hypothetical protein